jgi:hypothetical protein
MLLEAVATHRKGVRQRGLKLEPFLGLVAEEHLDRARTKGPSVLRPEASTVLRLEASAVPRLEASAAPQEEAP